MLSPRLLLPTLCVLAGASFTLRAENPAAAPSATPETATAKAAPFVIPADINGMKTIIAAPVKSRPIKVAIFDGKGAGADGIDHMCERIQSIPNAAITRVLADDWATIDLKPYDLVVFSGGSGSVQAASIGEQGRDNVREYVRGGGGYVGVCAGAYLACSNFSWSLGILNASTVSSKWQRGQGFMDLEVTDAGRQLLGDVRGTFKCRYHNGPIIKPGERADLPAYTPVALFRTEINEFGAPAGLMINSPSQALGAFGKGRVFISSPHPENTPGLENFIPRGAIWAAGETATKNTSTFSKTTAPAKVAAPVKASASPKSASLSPDTKAYQAALRALFPTLDANHDGSLAHQEIDAALADPHLTGDAAAALAVVKRLSRAKDWETQPHTIEAFLSITANPEGKNEKTVGGMFADGQQRIAALRRELFVEAAPKLASLHQGRMGNCFSLAPLGAMLDRNPEQVKAMFCQNADGTFSVKLGQRTVVVAPPTDAEVALSSSSRSTGLWANVYEKAAGIARNEQRPDKDRVSTPLDAIAHGGSAGTMLAFITGHEMVRFTLKWAKDAKTTPEEAKAKYQELRTLLTSAFAEHRCVTTGTLTPSLPGLHPGHAYGVLGYNAANDQIRLWDPHGDSFQPKGEPGPENGYARKDGILDLPLDVFSKQYAGLAFELMKDGTPGALTDTGTTE